MSRGNPNPSPMTRFKPGQSGNPGGRLKDPLTRKLREKLSEEDLDTILGTVIAFAKAGKPEFVHMIWDRIEGKAVARQEQGDPGAFSDLAHVPSEELIRRLDEYKRTIK
jgi:hypothetical protein